MRRVEKTKRQCEAIHAKRRALERYGVEMTSADLRAIVTGIQEQKAHFVERQSHRISIFIVKYGGQLMRVVYDRLRQQIVSFLPMEERGECDSV